MTKINLLAIRAIGVILIVLSFFCRAQAQSALYFPPVSGNTWDTVDPLSLGWCADSLDTFSDFLETKGTKAFIVLHRGKIALEWYYGSFTADSAWYWASAGKSLTAFLTGMAAEQGLLNLDSPAGAYLGNGWSSLTPAQERAVLLRHQLSMTTGLDDNVPDQDCTNPSCLLFKAAPGTRWAYHNAPYHLVHDELEQVSGKNITNFTASELSLKTGITGAWFQHVFYSKPRSAARFGLLMLNRGVWNADTLLHDTAYFREMINSSQSINPAYGYLWWLNGKSNYMLPQSQVVFNGPIIASAPADAYAALGKNDQKIYVVPSRELVIVRMGNDGGIPLYALSNFDDELWSRFSRLNCQPTGVKGQADGELYPFPNPVSTQLNIPESLQHKTYRLTDMQGRLLQHGELSNLLDMSAFGQGVYLLHTEAGVLKIDKQ